MTKANSTVDMLVGSRGDYQLRELEDRTQTVAHEKSSGPQDVLVELPGNSVGDGSK